MSTSPGLACLALLLFGAAASLNAGENGGLEFRGVVREGELCLVNLHQPAANISHWIPVGGEVAGVMVRSYDESTAQVTVIQQGRPLVLPLKRYLVSLAGPTAPLKLLGPGDRVSFADAPDMPDFLRDLPPEARKLLAEVRRRPAIRWPAPAGAAVPHPQ